MKAKSETLWVLTISAGLVLGGIDGRAGAQDRHGTGGEPPVVAIEGAEPPAPAVTPSAEDEARAGAEVRDLDFARDLALRGDLNLEGIRATREFSFGVPDRMQLVGDPELTLVITRSADLLPDVSSITVRVDGRPVATIPLDMEPSTPVTRTVTIPVGQTDGYHNVTLVAYHRSRLPCEIDEHPGLWSRIGANSFVRLHWAPREVPLDLAHWPRPFADDRDPDPAPVVFVLPQAPGEDTLRAAAYVASSLAHEIAWRALPLVVHQGDVASAPEGNLVVIRRDAAGGTGRITLEPRPGNATYGMLTLSGRDEGVLASLGQMLASDPTTRLPHGRVMMVAAWRAPRPLAARDWDGFAPQGRRFTFSDLGYRDQTVSGYRGGSATFPLRVLPDERVGDGGAQMELHYSYGPRVDPDQSRLHVLVDGVAVDGVRLSSPDGETRAKLQVNIPGHLIRPSSVVEVRFILPPERGPECTDSFPPNAFGTVHATTRLNLDRSQGPRTHDLSHLQYGGFPFGLRPDYAETTFVMPTHPNADEMQRLVWVAAELGRVAPSGRFLYEVALGSRNVTRDDDADRDLVVIDRDGAIARALGLDRGMRVHSTAGAEVVDVARRGAIRIAPDGRVATFEMTTLPWDDGRSALVVSGGDRRFYELAGGCAEEGDVLARLSGRAARVSSCRDVVAIAPVIDPRDSGDDDDGNPVAAFIRDRYWWLLGGLLALIGLVLLMRALIGGRRRVSPVPEPAE